MSQVQVETLLSEVMQIARECPMPTMVAAYVRAARKLCDKSRWLVRQVPGVTVANTYIYALNLAATGDTYNEVIGIDAMSLAENATVTNVLTERFSGGWDPNTDTNVPTGVPDSYQYLPGGYVALARTPDLAYTFLASVPVQPKRDSVSLDDTLVNTWDYALEAGALAYLLSLPRTPWTDKDESDE